MNSQPLKANTLFNIKAIKEWFYTPTITASQWGNYDVYTWKGEGKETPNVIFVGFKPDIVMIKRES